MASVLHTVASSKTGVCKDRGFFKNGVWEFAAPLQLADELCATGTADGKGSGMQQGGKLASVYVY